MKKILHIIDTQNGFARNDETKAKAKQIVELSKNNNFDCVLASQFINIKNSPYLKFMNWHGLMNSPEIDFYSPEINFFWWLKIWLQFY